MSRPALKVPAGRSRGGNFTEGPVHRHLIRLASYMFMGFSAMTISQLIEAVYLGHLGTKPLAAVSFTFPVIMVLQSFAMGMGVGASSIVSRTTGAGDREQVRRLVTHCLELMACLLIVLTVLGRLFSAPIFAMLGARGEVLHLIIQYMDIWFLGLPVFALSMMGTSLIRAVGNAEVPGIVMTVGSVLQIAIEPFLIFGLGPFPKLGIEGAALGFVIARAIGFVLCYYVVIFEERLLTTRLAGALASWKAIMHVGVPATATNLIMPVSMGIITRLLAGHGAAVVAGFGVGSRISSLMVMIVFAISASSGPFVGQNWGARKFERVDTALSLANRFVMAWGAIAFVLMIAFGRFFVSLINDNATVVEAADWYLVITPLSIGFMGMTAIASSCFNAMGQPIPPLIISIARMFVVYIPLAILFNYLWGYVGIFVATSLSSVLLGIVAWFWNRHAISSFRSRQTDMMAEAAV